MSRQRVPTSAILDLAVTPPKLSQAYLTQTAADARYPLKTDPDPYPIYLTQAEGDTRYQTPAQAAALYLPLAGGTLSGPGNLTVSGSLNAPLMIPASNVVEQRNGTSQQAFRIYNTYTDASNWERGFFRWQFGIFETGTEASGSGQVHAYRLGVAGQGDIILSSNFADRWRVEWQTGNYLPWDDNSVDLGSSSKRVKDIYAAGTINATNVLGTTSVISGSAAAGSNIVASTLTTGSSYGGDLNFFVTQQKRWAIVNTGHLAPGADNAYDIGGASPYRVRDIWHGGRAYFGSANEYIRNPVNNANNLSIESSDGYVFVAGKGAGHLLGNLYWDGTNWNRFDVAAGGIYVAAGQGTFSVATVPAGANPANPNTKASIDVNGLMTLASYSAQVAMGQYTATTAFNTTAVGTWVETPAQVTATFTGKRIRITGSACLYDSAASVGVYLGVMIDGVANASTAYFYTTGVSVSQTLSFTYYHPGLTGSHRISLCVQQQSAGTLTYNAAVPMLLYVTEERF